jgi:hypothetical protein
MIYPRGVGVGVGYSVCGSLQTFFLAATVGAIPHQNWSYSLDYGLGHRLAVGETTGCWLLELLPKRHAPDD